MARQQQASKVSAEEHGLFWRALNLVAVVLLCARMYDLVLSEPADWWIWLPVYSLGACVSLTVLLQASTAHNYAWRTLTALTIVCGSMYLAYSVWVVRDVASAALLYNGGELMEGRELLFMAVTIGWTVLNRLSVHRLDGLPNMVRFLVFLAVLSGCLLVAGFSACFFKQVGDQVPFCAAVFDPTIIWGTY